MFLSILAISGLVLCLSVHVSFLLMHNVNSSLIRFADLSKKIRVEQINAQPEHLQNWGRLFVHTKDQFAVYEPYIANQKRCEEVVMREFDRLKEVGGPPEFQQMVHSPTILSSFLLKPFQRLTKYPLMLSVGSLDAFGVPSVPFANR